MAGNCKLMHEVTDKMVHAMVHAMTHIALEPKSILHYARAIYNGHTPTLSHIK